MDNVARWTPTDLADLFKATSEKMNGVDPVFMEKDFWVCWTLKRLFNLENSPGELIFKGGTTLSKIYGAIARFSEDIDVAFHREDLGFEGEQAITSSLSTSQQGKRVKKLKEKCQKVIKDDFLPILKQAVTESLGVEESEGKWSLALAPENVDRDLQTILFSYPLGLPREDGYVKQYVRIEMGARSDHQPSSEGTVESYAAQYFSKLFDDPKCKVRHLTAERTFFEKLTILHRLHHNTKPIARATSRHYYDVVQLYNEGTGRKAINENVELLTEVSEHQQIFFNDKSAKYELAVPGTLRLVPSPSRKVEIEEDYQKMEDMFFEVPPSLDQIIETLQTIENEINGRV